MPKVETAISKTILGQQLGIFLKFYRFYKTGSPASTVKGAKTKTVTLLSGATVHLSTCAYPELTDSAYCNPPSLPSATTSAKKAHALTCLPYSNPTMFKLSPSQHLHTRAKAAVWLMYVAKADKSFLPALTTMLSSMEGFVLNPACVNPQTYKAFTAAPKANLVALSCRLATVLFDAIAAINDHGEGTDFVIPNNMTNYYVALTNLTHGIVTTPSLSAKTPDLNYSTNSEQVLLETSECDGGDIRTMCTVFADALIKCHVDTLERKRRKKSSGDDGVTFVNYESAVDSANHPSVHFYPQTFQCLQKLSFSVEPWIKRNATLTNIVTPTNSSMTLINRFKAYISALYMKLGTNSATHFLDQRMVSESLIQFLRFISLDSKTSSAKPDELSRAVHCTLDDVARGTYGLDTLVGTFTDSSSTRHLANVFARVHGGPTSTSKENCSKLLKSIRDIVHACFESGGTSSGSNIRSEFRRSGAHNAGFPLKSKAEIATGK